MEVMNLFVKPHPLLSDCIESHLPECPSGAALHKLGTGEFLFSEGDDVQHTFYIAHGLVKLYSSSEDGYSKTLFYHKARTLLGYQFLRGDNSATLNAVTCTPCEIYAVRSNEFRDFLLMDSEACLIMCEYLFSQLELLAHEAVNASLFPVLQRLAALLLALVDEQGLCTPPVMVGYNNMELSEMLGVHRNSVNNAISALKRIGCVEKKNNGLIIVHLDKLRDIAKGLAPSQKGIIVQGGTD